MYWYLKETQSISPLNVFTYIYQFRGHLVARKHKGTGDRYEPKRDFLRVLKGSLVMVYTIDEYMWRTLLLLKYKIRFWVCLDVLNMLIPSIHFASECHYLSYAPAINMSLRDICYGFWNYPRSWYTPYMNICEGQHI